MPTARPWDYLVVTAANDQQARSYEFQLRQREHAGELRRVRNCLVIPDIEGKRIGSGGSTLHCLARILERECSGDGARSFEEAEAVLRELRILIVHAGGDSRRLPSYCHCGKVFVPLPDETSSAAAPTLFDRLVQVFLKLPEGSGGQVVIVSGDALILFDPSSLDLRSPGITALGSWAPASEAAKHGVFCAREDGSVTRYLQKPSVDEQSRSGTVNHAGQSLLDLGVMSCDATTAVRLMRAFFTHGLRPDGEPGLVWKAKSLEVVLSHGIDFYREICCAMGTGTQLDARLIQYVQSVQGGSAHLDATLTSEWFRSLHEIPLHVCVLSKSKFLHFGTTRQLITSGLALVEEDSGKPATTTLILNSVVQGDVAGNCSWIEGCSIDSRLMLEGFNVVVGADITEPLTLAKGACFDLSKGVSRAGAAVWFLRCYDIDDSFKHTVDAGGMFCGIPLGRWLNNMGAAASDIWSPDVPSHERTLWTARVFPALEKHQEFRQWLWLFDAGSATADQKSRFWTADRYSSSEISLRVDQSQFHARRDALRSAEKRVNQTSENLIWER